MQKHTLTRPVKNIRVAIIGTTGLPARYGGFETLAAHLVTALSKDFEMTVYCSSKYFGKKGKRLTEYKGARLQYINLNANGYQSIPYDIFSMLHAVRHHDVLLVLGVSGAILLPFLKLFTKKPVLINIDGQEWKRAKWNRIVKKILGFSEKLAVAFADQVICDNKVIQQYVEREYRCDKTVLIEYGGDHVKALPQRDETIRRYPFLQHPYAFNVSRIEPENNIHVMLEAFSRCPERNLVIVGMWHHNTYGIRLREKYGKYPNIFLMDTIYDQEKLDEIRSNADVYVHGHSAGGTNPSLVEAMCLGLPVISYGVSYNRETTNNAARYFYTADDLVSILRSMKTTEKKAIAAEMQDYGLRTYTWQRITSMYAAIFRGEKPTVNRLLDQLHRQVPEPVTIDVNTNPWEEA